MLEHEIRDVQGKDRESVIERVVLQRNEIVEYNRTWRNTKRLDFIRVRPLEDIFPDNQDCNSRNSNIFLCPRLTNQFHRKHGKYIDNRKFGNVDFS